MTVPEKSQPITFEGGSDMEACCHLSVLLGLEEGVQTIGWVQGYVGHFYADLRGDGDGVEGWGARHRLSLLWLS